MADEFVKASDEILAPFAHSVTNGQPAAEYRLKTKIFRMSYAADALAADTWTRTLGQAEQGWKLTKVRIIPDATLTANDTNYATLSVAVGAIGSTASIDSFNTKITGGSGNWAVATPEEFTIVPTDTLSQDHVITYSKAVTAAGVVVPAHCVEVHYEYTDYTA